METKRHDGGGTSYVHKLQFRELPPSLSECVFSIARWFYAKFIYGINTADLLNEELLRVPRPP